MSYYKTWLAIGFELLDGNEKVSLVITYWAIWYAWNRLIHDGVKQSIQDLVVFIKGYQLELQALEGLTPSSCVPK